MVFCFLYKTPRSDHLFGIMSLKFSSSSTLPSVDSRTGKQIIQLFSPTKALNIKNSREDGFYIMDMGVIEDQHVQFIDLMPRVKPFYAMKCFPDRYVIHKLMQLGCGFDCASLEEIKTVLEIADGKHVDIIFANPCKLISHLQFAKDHGVNVMTFDNIDELYKIKMVHPTAQLVLRIRTDDSKSKCKLGIKYGAQLSSSAEILLKAMELQLRVIGVSFHVGSGCFDASAFSDAIKASHQVFQIAASFGLNFTLLDIGGGFPGSRTDSLSIEHVARTVNPLLDQLFPNCAIIAEPGRYYVSAACTLFTTVIGRRVVHYEGEDLGDDAMTLPSIPLPKDQIENEITNYENVQKGDVINASQVVRNEQPGFMYYISEGTYGAFNCVYFDHAEIVPKVLTRYHQLVDNVLNRLNVPRSAIESFQM
eukprot:NODE_87_length_21935_cov_0.397142.p4 type:complete len:421 gc:universal NODE_87_length_21935_cov_0.397142:7407-8669(+)